MLKTITIITILFMAQFGGLIESIGVPKIFSLVSEFLIYFLLIISFASRSSKGFLIPHLWHIILAFALVTIVSITVNAYSYERSIFSFRYLFRFLFFYTALIYAEPDEKILKKINLIILIFFVLQFPIVAAKFYKFGINERTSGGYAVHDGSLSTTVPISLIFYLASFYYQYKPKISYVLIGFGYVVCSIVGAKRGDFIFIPFTIHCHILFFVFKSNKKKYYKKDFFSYFHYYICYYFIRINFAFQ